MLLLASCSHVAKLPDSYVFDEKTRNGVVVVSLTFEGGLKFSAFTLEYRPVKGGETQRMHSANILSPPDIESDGRRGWLFPRELPPGEYEFYKWQGMVGAGTGYMTYWSPVEFSHRFTVVPGRATYIGNLNVLTTVGGRYQVQVRDERDRDVAAFLARQPKIRPAQIEYGIMSDNEQARGRPMQIEDFKNILVPAK